MKSFIKIFFASFFALVIFTVIVVVAGLLILGALTHPPRPETGSRGVLVLDLSDNFKEQAQNNPIGGLLGSNPSYVPGLYDVVRMIRYARLDTSIKGIYIKADENANGFASSEEIREALQEFKQSNKFIIAYGEVISQKAYYVASIADKIYCNPTGGLEFNGFSSNLFYLKGLLDKLEIQPQIFFAGKFKSATEPLRVTRMTDANRLQTNVWLGDLYNNFLLETGNDRHIDTATLHSFANNFSIQNAGDALKYHLVDGLKYDDELREELRDSLQLGSKDQINFVSLSTYGKAVDFKAEGSGRIAIIYAQGDIVDGEGADGQIGSDRFVELIRNARRDDNIKAIVFRVNSPGGSSLASDVIWREISLARKVKPVVVSMGDYAASGGYFISCEADSVFADPGTITGSIGVFSIIPNYQSFFRDKLGITFDGVKTAPYADIGSSIRPLTAGEKSFIQADVDSIYGKFKRRVAAGRKKDITYIDSIAQGRVWTGKRALSIGLIDKIGGLQDAVECAAGMAGLTAYETTEYPGPRSMLKELFGGAFQSSVKENSIKSEIGAKQYQLFMKVKSLRHLFGVPQARLPFEMEIQ